MYHRVVVNGRLELVDLRVLVATLFRLLHPQFTPLPLLLKNVMVICSMLERYCAKRKAQMKVDHSERRKETIRQRARLTFMMRKIKFIRISFGYVKNRHEFLVKYYNLVLDLEGMGFLTGYGIMQRSTNARLCANPEHISLRELQQRD
jgi:hypothetical protein